MKYSYTKTYYILCFKVPYLKINVSSTNCLISSKLLFVLLKIATNCLKISKK